MTNAHYHRDGATYFSRCGKEYKFVGVHPWAADATHVERAVIEVRRAAVADGSVGIGEIGLDRLRTKLVTSAQRTLFEAQLKIAADLHRPVVLHGAKCWGEVVKAVKPFANEIPAFLFHGFSRSVGLLPEIVEVNGFLSVGKAVLNDHAVNYRRLVGSIPLHRLLVETDDGADSVVERDALLADIFAKASELTGITEALIDVNAAEFLHSFNIT